MFPRLIRARPDQREESQDQRYTYNNVNREEVYARIRSFTSLRASVRTTTESLARTNASLCPLSIISSAVLFIAPCVRSFATRSTCAFTVSLQSTGDFRLRRERETLVAFVRKFRNYIQTMRADDIACNACGIAARKTEKYCKKEIRY